MLLNYDLESCKHGSAQEEWGFHKLQHPDTAEWIYLTCSMTGANGHEYTLFYSFTDSSSEINIGFVNAGMPEPLPKGAKPHNDLAGIDDYTTGFHNHKFVFANMTDESVFDAKTNTIITDNGTERITMSYEGDCLKFDAVTDVYEAHLKFVGGNNVMWHSDSFGKPGIVHMGVEKYPMFFYSLPRLPFYGTLKYTDDKGKIVETDVTGRGWVDHQWSRTAYGEYGWDWISLRFGNGESVNIYKFRTGHNVGTYQKVDGTVEYFSEFEVVNDGYYAAPNGQKISFGWTIKLPFFDHELKVIPLSDKDIVYLEGVAFYYEGMTSLLDESGERIGSGFVEIMQ